MPRSQYRNQLYMRWYRQPERPQAPALSAFDMQVLEVAVGGYTAPEIAEALDISEEAAFKAFERVAAFLAPTPASKVPGGRDSLPFVDELYVVPDRLQEAS